MAEVNVTSSTAAPAPDPAGSPQVSAPPSLPEMREASPRVDTRPIPHLPPPSVASAPSSPYEERAQRTIKINVEIVIPKLLLGAFGVKYRSIPWQGRPKSFWHRMLIAFIGILYLSFIIGQSVCWGIAASDLGIAIAPVIIATFLPFLDLVGNIWVVRLMKSDKEHDAKHPSFHHAFVLVINTILLTLEFIILIFACVWADQSISRYWYYRSDDLEAVAGLTLYSMCTMIVMKLVLAFLVFRSPETFTKFREVTTRVRRRSSGYEELGQEHYDEDARIRPGTIAAYNDEDETPRNSTEQGRILLL